MAAQRKHVRRASFRRPSPLSPRGRLPVVVIPIPSEVELQLTINRSRARALAAAGVAVLSMSFAGQAAAATTEVVSEADVTRAPEGAPPTDSWMLYTRAGTPPTAGAFVAGPATPPLGAGSFRTNTATGAEKVFLFNYDHIGTDLGDVDDIGYSTYRTAGAFQQAPALNLQIDFNGPAVDGGFSTLVFEPVYNTAQGSVVNGEWQDWIADGSGIWWSTRPINNQCAGALVVCLRTWDEIVANNPDATVLGGVGVNQGSGNPGLDANTDAFTFDETTYDFEVRPTSKDDCKNGGWMNYGTTFGNQGDCVSFVATQGKNQPKG